MGIKLLGFALYWSALSSLAYSAYTGNESISGVGIAVAWVSIILTLFTLSAALIVCAVGSDKQKLKIKQSFTEATQLKSVWGSVRSLALFMLIAITGAWVTAAFYGISSLAFRLVGYSIKQGEDKTV